MLLLHFVVDMHIFDKSSFSNHNSWVVTKRFVQSARLADETNGVLATKETTDSDQSIVRNQLAFAKKLNEGKIILKKARKTINNRHQYDSYLCIHGSFLVLYVTLAKAR